MKKSTVSTKFRISDNYKTNPVYQKNSREEMTIDIQAYMVPVSIILSSIVISLAIFLTFKNGLFSSSNGNTLGQSNIAGQPTTNPSAGNVPAPSANGTSAKTTISDSPILGDKTKAKIAIVEFSDYECPFCKRHFEQVYDQIKQNYIDTGKVILVYRNYPLSFHDPAATLEATAALCVRSLSNDQKYYDYHDLIFKNTTSNGVGIAKDKLASLAGGIGISQNDFNTCLNSDKFKSQISKDIADGSAAGVSGTPGFIIGKIGSDGITVDGTLIAGAYPYSEFQKIIDPLLTK